MSNSYSIPWDDTFYLHFTLTLSAFCKIFMSNANGFQFNYIKNTTRTKTKNRNIANMNLIKFRKISGWGTAFTFSTTISQFHSILSLILRSSFILNVYSAFDFTGMGGGYCKWVCRISNIYSLSHTRYENSISMLTN